MATIEIAEDQRAYLEELGEELEARHVGEYGTVRHRDALQFLIDQYEEDTGTVEGTPEGGLGDSDAGQEVGEEAASEDEEPDGEDEEPDGEDDEGGGRLQTMMQLLDDHDDKWEAVDSEEGKYAVTLPDGDTEHVRTKDDVRALLFQHYA